MRRTFFEFVVYYTITAVIDSRGSLFSVDVILNTRKIKAK